MQVPGMKFMRYTVKFVVLMALLLTAGSCKTIAGVSEKGEEETPPPGFTSTFPYDRYVEGRPVLDLRAQGGFYIWRTGNLWSVRMARKIEPHPVLPPIWPVVTGSISVENALTVDVRRQNVNLWNDVRPKRNDIFFKFEIRDDIRGHDIEGFDFTVKPLALDYCVTIELMVDGVPRPGIVHLGNFMHIPDTLPLRICLHSFR